MNPVFVCLIVSAASAAGFVAGKYFDKGKSAAEIFVKQIHEELDAALLKDERGLRNHVIYVLSAIKERI